MEIYASLGHNGFASYVPKSRVYFNAGAHQLLIIYLIIYIGERSESRLMCPTSERLRRRVVQHWLNAITQGNILLRTHADILILELKKLFRVVLHCFRLRLQYIQQRYNYNYHCHIYSSTIIILQVTYQLLLDFSAIQTEISLEVYHL